MFLWSFLLGNQAIAAEPAIDPDELVALEATAGALMGGVAGLGTAWAVAELNGGVETSAHAHLSDPWNETTLGIAAGWYAGMSIGASFGVWSTKRYYGDAPDYGRVLGGGLVGSAVGAVIAGASVMAWEQSPQVGIAGLVIGGGLAPVAGAVIAAEAGRRDPTEPEPQMPAVAVWAAPGPGGGMLGATGMF